MNVLVDAGGITNRVMPNRSWQNVPVFFFFNLLALYLLCKMLLGSSVSCSFADSLLVCSRWVSSGLPFHRYMPQISGHAVTTMYYT